jgi:hypothetical protein
MLKSCKTCDYWEKQERPDGRRFCNAPIPTATTYTDGHAPGPNDGKTCPAYKNISPSFDDVCFAVNTYGYQKYQEGLLRGLEALRKVSALANGSGDATMDDLRTWIAGEIEKLTLEVTHRRTVL